MNSPKNNHERFPATPTAPAARGHLKLALSTFAALAILVCSSVLAPCLAGVHAQNSNTVPQEDAKALDAAIDQAIQLVVEAQKLIDADNLDQGETKLRQAFAAYDRLPAENAHVIFGHANCYYFLGSVAEKRGDAEKAFNLWKQAIPLYEKLTGQSATDNLVETLKRMGQLLINADQTEDALSVLRKIDDIQEGADSAVRATNKSNIGVLLRRLGRQQEAEQELQQAVTLSGLGDSTPEEKARYLFNLGLAEVDLHHTKSAIEHYRQSLRFLEGLENKEETRAETLTALAQALTDEGDREEALTQLTAAFDAIKDKPELTLLKAKILIECSRALPDATQAQKGAIIKTLREVLSLVERQKGTENIQVTCVENLGVRLQETGNLDEAIRSYKELLARFSQKPFNPTTSQLDELYKNLAIYLLDAGRASESLDSFLLSLGNAWQGMAARLPSLTHGDTLQSATDVSRRANIIYSIALASQQTMAPRAYEALLQTKALYSEANRAREQRLLRATAPGAAAVRERYIELRRRISRRTLDSTHTEVAVSNEVMAQMATEVDRLERELLDASKNLPADLDLQRVHSSQVSSQLRPGEVLLDYFTYYSYDLKTRKTQGRRYGVFVVHAGGAIEAVDIGDAETVVKAIQAFRDCEATQIANAAFNENELARFGESIRRLVLDPALPSRDSLKRVYVAPDGVLGLFPFDALPTAKGSTGWKYLAEDVEVVSLTSGRELTRTASSRSTSSEVWLLGDPDFDASPNERVAGFNNPAHFESASFSAKNTPNAKQGAVLMGGSPGADDTETTIPANWQSLPATQVIVNTAAVQAAKAGLKTKVLLGADASEENLSRVSSPRLLMFATHGYYMKKMPPVYASGSIHINSNSDSLTAVDRSKVAPGQKVNGIVVDNPDFWQTSDPLQRNMMILAGANKRTHYVVRYLVNGQLLADQTAKLPTVGQQFDREIGDGLLTAYEVLGVDLSGTDLVVLAGCESGLGVSSDSEDATGFRQESESVVGLRQAFTMAGARSVVTSIWNVPLDTTVQQMSFFLDAWLSGQRPRYQAFHESQLNALRGARNNNLGGHPFWWAGFIYFGDPGDR